MITFNMDPQQLEGFHEMVYGSGESGSPDDVFRRSWDYLRQIGIDTGGTRVERPARPQANPEVVAGRRAKAVSNAAPPIRPTAGTTGSHRKDPELMSQRDYEAWRRKAR